MHKNARRSVPVVAGSEGTVREDKYFSKSGESAKYPGAFPLGDRLMVASNKSK